MDPVIFLDKVRRPDQRGLVRERLDRATAALRPGATDPVSLALVLGPPGSGKTTLLSHLAGAADAPAAWLRLGSEDDNESALSRHLGHTLAGALTAPDLLAATADGRITGLIQALDERPARPALLVIDDLHEIVGTPAEDALESFLRLRPRTLKIVLGSRRPPLINTSRLLVSGELVEFDGDTLRFRSWEVEQLYRTVYAAALSPEAAAALTRRTGGWAAGLHLFHLATAGMSRADRERAVDELGGRSRLVRSYLARNVLGGLDPERRRFLLLTATLGVLTGDLCDDLLGTSGSAGVLAALEEEQFFTTSTDGGLTYQYHQVLQTHLDVLLVDELGGRAAREVYARSGRLLEAAGRIAAAIRAHARAEDWGSVGRLLKPGPPAVTTDDRLWGLLALPGAPSDDPGLVIAGARRLARCGQLGEAVAAYRRAESLLDDPAFSRRCALERQSVGLWTSATPLLVTPELVAFARLSVELRELLRGTVTGVRDNLSGAGRPVRLGNAAGSTAAIGSAAAARGSAGAGPSTLPSPLTIGLRLLFRDDLDGAERELGGADAGDDLSGGWAGLARRLALAWIDLLREPEIAAARRVEEVVLEADVGGWPWLARIARGVQRAALLACSPDDWRVAAAVDELNGLDREADRWTACLDALALGVGFGWAGLDELAWRSFNQATRLAGLLGAPLLGRWAGRLIDRPLVRGGTRVDLADSGAASILLSAGAAGVTTPDPRAGATPSPVVPAAPALPPGQAVPAPVASHIELRCLGGFSLTVDGAEVGWRDLRPRARSLLMLLAMHHQHAVHRERIVDMLWPDASLAAGIRSLQVAVSSIRQSLAFGGVGAECLARLGDSYLLRLPGTDQLADFERDARVAATHTGPEGLRIGLQALAAYAGDLLPEAGPADWVVEERDRLRRLAAAVGSAAAATALATGDPRTALGAAQRSVDLDPYHDSAWDLLIESLDRLGDHAAGVVARRDQSRIWADLGLPSRALGSPGAGSALSGGGGRDRQKWSPLVPSGFQDL